MDILNSPACKVMALLLLATGTLLFFNFYDRYTTIGPELLRDPHMGNHLSAWSHSSPGVVSLLPEENGARLSSDTSTQWVHVTQRVPGFAGYPLLRLAYDTRTDDVSQGPEPGMTARIVLDVDIPGTASRRQHTRVLTSLLGTGGWEHHDSVFAVAAGTTRLSVSAQLFRATGTLRVRNLSLLPVRETQASCRIRITVLILWAVAAAWISAPIALSSLGHTHRMAVIVLAITILLGVLMPDSLKQEIGDALSSPAVDGARKLVQSHSSSFSLTPLWPRSDPFKVGHFVLFSILSFVAFVQRSYRLPHGVIFGYLLLFAFVTEILQLFVPGRTAQLGDLLIDSAGITVALTLLRTARTFHPKK